MTNRLYFEILILMILLSSNQNFVKILLDFFVNVFVYEHVGQRGAPAVCRTHQADHLHPSRLHPFPREARHGGNHLQAQAGPGLRLHLHQPDTAGALWLPGLGQCAHAYTQLENTHSIYRHKY